MYTYDMYTSAQQDAAMSVEHLALSWEVHGSGLESLLWKIQVEYLHLDFASPLQVTYLASSGNCYFLA